MNDRVHDASFRDPSGFIYQDPEGRVLRQVNKAYEDEYVALVKSGFWDNLMGDGLMVPHKQVDISRRYSDEAFAILQPDPLPFISYPYEWCFGQLRAAALLTMKIQRRALKAGFVLKDASAYNIQFIGCRPVFIDTLSFERYQDGEPWIAYRQFCRHFLAPLALMHYVSMGANRALIPNLDGVPVDEASDALPLRSWLRMGLAIHLHLHGRAERRHKIGAHTATAARSSRVSKGNLVALVHNLEATVRRLRPKRNSAVWTNYQGADSYTPEGVKAKQEWVRARLESLRPSTVWDLGSNTGEYSRIAADLGAYVVAMDGDVTCVERNWHAGWKAHDTRILPLAMDLTNPSPASGWAHTEHASLLQRGPADCALALALMHHLTIGNNVPFDRLATFFASTGRRVLMEFVPKEDPQTQRMLQGRRDIFTHYTRDAFEAAFRPHFEFEDVCDLPASGRVLYCMRRTW